MLIIKIFEDRLGSISWWSNYIKKLDIKIHNFFLKIRGKINLWKKIANLFLFDFLPRYIAENISKLGQYLHEKYVKSAENLRGEKRIIKNQSNASEFLQNISTQDKNDRSYKEMVDKLEKEELK